MDSSVAVVIAAAGSGSRLPGAAPKQWRPLGGMPLIAHAFRFFDAFPGVDQLALALDPATLALPARLRCLQSSRGKPVRLVEGAASRQESVWRAIQALAPRPEIVLIHDAARPFPPEAGVNACIAAARACGGAILALPVIETIKRVDADGRVVETLDRNRLRAAQTPQGFRCADLENAYRLFENRLGDFTDDAALHEAAGGAVRTVPGDADNFKVTLPGDFDRAEEILRRRAGKGPA